MDKKTINPPTKEIVFKNDLVHDDNELNKYIQKTRKINKTEASKIIDEFVASVKKRKGKDFLWPWG
jgi:hypothetical protein